MLVTPSAPRTWEDAGGVPFGQLRERHDRHAVIQAVAQIPWIEDREVLEGKILQRDPHGRSEAGSVLELDLDPEPAPALEQE